MVRAGLRLRRDEKTHSARIAARSGTDGSVEPITLGAPSFHAGTYAAIRRGVLLARWPWEPDRRAAIYGARELSTAWAEYNQGFASIRR